MLYGESVSIFSSFLFYISSIWLNQFFVNWKRGCDHDVYEMADIGVNKPKVVSDSYMCNYIVSNVTPKTAEMIEEID